MRSLAKCSLEEMEVIRKHPEIAEETLSALHESYGARGQDRAASS